MPFELQHFVITRFSYRSRTGASPMHIGFAFTNDPLNPQRLAARFDLFGAVCLPSLLAQTNQRFCWIFLVDPELSHANRTRLLTLCRARADRTRLVEFHPRLALGSLSWLRPFIDGRTTHVMTTHLDDDDTLSVGYVDYAQAHVRRQAAAQDVLSFQIVAVDRCHEWDLVPGPEAVFGYRKVRLAAQSMVSPSAGFSVCCKYPEYDLNVLSFSHAKGGRYVDAAYQNDNDTTLARLRSVATANGDDWRSWSPNTHFHLVSMPNPPTLMTNHIENDQPLRLFDDANTSEPVRGLEDFPGFILELDAVRPLISRLRPTPFRLMRRLVRGLIAIAATPADPMVRWRRAKRLLRLPGAALRGRGRPSSQRATQGAPGST